MTILTILVPKAAETNKDFPHWQFRWQCNPRWRSLHNKIAGVCWSLPKQTVLQPWNMCSEAFITEIYLLTSPFWSGIWLQWERMHLWQRKKHSWSYARDYTRHAAKSLDWVWLLPWYLSSNKRDTHRVSLISTNATINFVSFCKCRHQNCKNIHLTIHIINNWNQGVFLWPPCIQYSMLVCMIYIQHKY